MVPSVTVTARPAHPDDSAPIARIYNEGIEDRVATFETDLRTAAQVRTLLEDRRDSHPAVVVEHGGEVIAFAWTSPYSDRPCYAGVAEFSVYVAREARGSGAGRAAMDALLAACEAGGFWKLTSRIFPENAASRRLCERVGFSEIGVHRRHARLDGSWRDCVVVERLLGEAAH